MPVVIDEMPRRTQNQKKELKNEKLEVMAEPSWIEKVESRAKRLGISLSAYIRQAVNKEMIREDEQANRSA